MAGQAEQCEFGPGLVLLFNSEIRRRNSETVNVSSGPEVRIPQIDKLPFSAKTTCAAGYPTIPDRN